MRKALRQDVTPLQQRRLQTILEAAYRDVPFYRNLMSQARLRPTLDDFPRLPVTESSVYYNLPEEQSWSQTLQGTPYEARHTSGSMSGKPRVIPVTPTEAAHRALVVLRFDLESGHRLWRRQAFIQRPPMREERWFKRVGILPSSYRSLFDDPAVLADWLRDYRPARLFGQPSALTRVARHIRGLQIPYIVTLGERLSVADRELLEGTFRGRVHHCYGTSEVGIIGWECEQHRGFHVNVDETLVECLRDGKPVPKGEVGEIVLTNLRNFIRPFIRVQTGDLGRFDPDPCRFFHHSQPRPVTAAARATRRGRGSSGAGGSETIPSSSHFAGWTW